jgi:copper transport protein
VDNLDVSHPEGHQQWMGVGLRPGLPDGTYTATYRVISADTHIVYGGLVFNIGHAGAAPKYTVAGLINRNKTGQATSIAFGIVRALDYTSLALGLGGLVFLAFVWLPALGASTGAETGWTEASRALASRLWLLLMAAVMLGLLASVLGILLQGASAAGVSLWGSWKGAIVNDTLSSRFGVVWGARAIVWAVLGVALIAARAARREAIPVLQPAGPGACWPIGDPVDRRSAALGPRLPAVLLLAAGAGAAYLAITPALSGHASVQSPTWVFFPADVLHVLAASVWTGGIACLLLALPAATRRLQGPQRTLLLTAVLVRFSRLALCAVVALAITGLVQAYIDVRGLDGLLHTTYGQLLLVKSALFAGLLSLGWANRQHAIPALRRVAASAGTPGGAGRLIRRTLRGELALLLSVFGVTAALVAYAPPIDIANGPFSSTTALGPAELEMTVEPARVGLNTIHLYLIDAKTGTQFTQTKELTATARLPAKSIGPLPLKVNVAGPGHYILSSVELTPGGTWTLQLVDRVSEFNEFSKAIQVPIR